jgi:hypothetical protein
MEYRQPNLSGQRTRDLKPYLPDAQLSNLRGKTIGDETVDISGLLVRLGALDSDENIPTLLLDTNTDELGAGNNERFHDSFLNVG